MKMGQYVVKWVGMVTIRSDYNACVQHQRYKYRTKPHIQHIAHLPLTGITHLMGGGAVTT